MATIATSALAGNVIKAIETRTGKIPSKYFVWSGLGLLAVSATLHILNRKQFGKALGQLASPLLMMGLYNKATQEEHAISRAPKRKRKSD